MNKRKTKFHFFALAVTGTGISGGDRIFIELARRWSKKFSLTIHTSHEGKRLCNAQNLKEKKLTITSLKNKSVENLFLINYVYKIFAGIKLGLTLTLEEPKNAVLYPASEFWMDFIPSFLIKLRYPQAKLVATWYQTAPSPLRGYNEQKTKNKKHMGREEGYNFSALLYWLAQLPIKPLVKKYADKVIVNNEDEKKRYPEHTERGDTIVLIGAVPLSDIRRYQNKKQRTKNKEQKKYAGVFQGRFHPQKGVVELIDIWKKVVDEKPKAKLAMIGDGPLMDDVRTRITEYGLQENVKLFGYVFDGPKKYKIFSQSKVVLHPAFYDSGGMASAEAMAFGIPCVGFDLKAYESYYQKGMLKVEKGNLDAFAKKVVKLLEDKKLYEKTAGNAGEMIEKNWSWDKRAQEILDQIM